MRSWQTETIIGATLGFKRSDRLMPPSKVLVMRDMQRSAWHFIMVIPANARQSFFEMSGPFDKGCLISNFKQWLCGRTLVLGKYGISYRELWRYMERGEAPITSTIYRCNQRYAPAINPRSAATPSDLARGTWMKNPYEGHGRWAHLYWAVDSRGCTVDFYLLPVVTAKLHTGFCKILNNVKKWQIPRFINTDKAPAYGRALALLKREGRCPSDVEHRQIKYRNNVIECDHGKLKRDNRRHAGI